MTNWIASGNLRRYLVYFCLGISMASLLSAFGIAGNWLGIAASFLLGVGWYKAKDTPREFWPHLFLALSTLISGYGILSGSMTILMLIGNGFAFAMWDVILLDQKLQGNPDHEQNWQYEVNHLTLLAVILILALASGIAGRLLRLDIPFIVLVVGLLVMIFSFHRLFRMFDSSSH